MFHLENVTANHGFLITIGGILLVFFGLVLINIAVVVMNYFFNRKEGKSSDKDAVKVAIAEDIVEEKPQEIPPEHVAVIFAAVELYRRLHFDIPKGGISIRRSNESYNSWKMGQMYGQRS